MTKDLGEGRGKEGGKEEGGGIELPAGLLLILLPTAA